MIKNRVKILKNKTCGKKVSFKNKKIAAKVALKHNQNMYECPICFCYHLTHYEDWSNEFVSLEDYKELEVKIIKLNDTIVNFEQRIEKILRKNVKLKDGRQAHKVKNTASYLSWNYLWRR
jgi:hypothetical protein